MPLPYGESRRLTPGEVLLASKVFGASIQYAQVKIHHGKYMLFQPDHVVMTPNGEIYFPTRFYEDDYSSNSLDIERQHLFIHEMVHVWQYQLGYPVKMAGLFESAFGHGYDYDLKPDAKLSDYPMETQANIIADYAMYALFNKSDKPLYCSRWYYKKMEYSLARLDAVLADFINNPSDKGNLPKTNNTRCETEPNTVDCLTR